MPTGFETRQPGVSTFASNPPAPVQVNPSAQDNTQRVQTVGGNSQSGAVEDNTQVAGVAGPLGGFFASIMEPHVKARQQEEFVKGAVEQMSRQAGDEIHSSNGGFSKIFGQTSYVEGAVNYSVQKAVNDWGTKTLADRDTLKQLPPDELAKHVSASISALSTGDAYTDKMVQAGVFEASGPVVQTIAKDRYIWQQHNAADAFTGNMTSSAGLLQQVGMAAASQTGPTEDGGKALAQAGNNFRAAAMIPTGMDEDTYKKSLGSMVRSLAQGGNGYAVTALMHSGVLNILDEKDQVAAQDAYERYGNKAQGDAVLNDPHALYLLYDLELLRRDDDGKQSAAMVEKKALEANDYIKRITGYDRPFFDAKDVSAYGASVAEAIHAADLRAKAYNQSIADKMLEHKLTREDKQWEIDQQTNAAKFAYANGNAAQGIAGKMGDEGMYNTLSNNDFVKGNYAPLVKNYQNGNYVAPLVKDTAQGQLKAALGTQYSPAVEQAHKQWSAVRDASPALAKEIYGTGLDLQMSNYDNLVGKGAEPHQAYATAFMDPSRYMPAQMPPARRKEAGTILASIVSNEIAWSFLPGSRAALNESSQKALGDALWNDFAVKSQNSSLSNNAVAAGLIENAYRSGSFERYGSLGWNNGRTTKPLGQLLGLQQNEADDVVTSAVDAGLKASGFSKGAGGKNYVIMRISDEHERPALYVQALDDHPDNPETALITFADLKARASALKQTRQPINLDPMRRVPGETPAQRMERIRVESAPLMHKY